MKKRYLRFTALLLFCCCITSLIPAAAATEPELCLAAGIGLTAEDKKVVSWADERGNGNFLEQRNISSAPWTDDDGNVCFDSGSYMSCSSDYEGASTVFAVVRVRKIGLENDFLFKGLKLDSTAISSSLLERNEKILGYVPGTGWFNVALRQSVSGGSRKISLWINGEKTANELAISEFLPIYTLGRGDFDIKAFRVFRGALSDAEIKSQIDAAARQYIPEHDVVAEATEFRVDNGQIQMVLNLRSKIDTDGLMLGVLRDTSGNLINSAQNRVSLSSSKIARAELSMPYAEGESTAVSVYIWQAETLRPLAEINGISVYEIGYEGPKSTEPLESSKTIPEFQSSLPSQESMRLKLDLFEEPAPAFLAAKGWLELSDYQPNSPMDAQIFAETLARMSGVVCSVSRGNITRVRALEEIYRVLQRCRKAFQYESNLPFADIDGLTNAQKESVNTCFLSGIIGNEERISPNALLTQKDAAEWLTRCAVNAEFVQSDCGAEIPYMTYYARYAKTNGTRLKSIADINGSYAADNIAFEAEGKECITLGMGDYIVFSDSPAAERLILRYHIPKSGKSFDSSGNALPFDSTASVGLYVNGEKRQDVTLHSLPLYSAKSEEGYKGLFADAIISEAIKEGDNVEFRADSANGFPQADDFSSGIGISLLRFESLPDIRSCPEGFIDASNYGACPDDMIDDTLAIQDAIDRAYLLGTGVYLPAGTYRTGKKLVIPSGVHVTGAGMWYTVIDCPYDNVYTRGGRTGFSIGGRNVEISHLKISASNNYRRTGNTASCINGKGENAYIHDVWMEKGGTGLWAELYRSRIERCRITDSFADGIHLTGPSQDVDINNCLITGGGDDGIATTGETRGGSVLTNITVRNNTVEAVYHGRGIMLSGTARSVIEDNYVAYIFRNPAILAWTENNYDTMSVYGITIRRNICVASKRNPGLHRGAITLFCNREGHWADGDIYDNETYKNQMIHGCYSADCEDSGESAARTYSEISNNIAHMSQGTAYRATESFVRSSATIIKNGKALTLSF